jgi:hypothetical protein
LPLAHNVRIGKNISDKENLSAPLVSVSIGAIHAFMRVSLFGYPNDELFTRELTKSTEAINALSFVRAT